MSRQDRPLTFAEMLQYAERAFIELEEARTRLRSAYNQEFRDNFNKAKRGASTSNPESGVVPIIGQLLN